MQSPGGSEERLTAQNRAAKKDWGLLEPIRPIFEPVADILQPLFTGNVMYGLLVGLLVATWFGFDLPPGRASSKYTQHPQVGFYSPDRVAAYEEMWRREDSELWEWLEERVGTGRLHAAARGAATASASAGSVRKKAVEPRTLEEKMREERMDERQVQEAIRVTEEKLSVLRETMGKLDRDDSPRMESASEETL
jgi:hypothetical protein